MDSKLHKLGPKKNSRISVFFCEELASLFNLEQNDTVKIFVTLFSGTLAKLWPNFGSEKLNSDHPNMLTHNKNAPHERFETGNMLLFAIS